PLAPGLGRSPGADPLAARARGAPRPSRAVVRLPRGEVRRALRTTRAAGRLRAGGDDAARGGPARESAVRASSLRGARHDRGSGTRRPAVAVAAPTDA